MTSAAIFIILHDILSSPVALLLDNGWMKWKELFLNAAHENIPTKTIKNINGPLGLMVK